MRPISDETWRQLDPYAGRLSRRDLRRAVLAAVTAVLLLGAGYVVATSGLLVPNIAFGNGWGHSVDSQTRLINYDFEVVNRGRFPVEITDVGRSGPGLELLDHPAEGGAMAGVRTSGRLEPGKRMTLGLSYRVTDCHAVPAEPWPVPVRIARPWGTQTLWIEMRTEPGRDYGPWEEDDWDEDGWEDDAPWRDTDEDVEWQRGVADIACN